MVRPQTIPEDLGPTPPKDSGPNGSRTWAVTVLSFWGAEFHVDFFGRPTRAKRESRKSLDMVQIQVSKDECPQSEVKSTILNMDPEEFTAQKDRNAKRTGIIALSRVQDG